MHSASWCKEIEPNRNISARSVLGKRLWTFQWRTIFRHLIWKEALGHSHLKGQNQSYINSNALVSWEPTFRRIFQASSLKFELFFRGGMSLYHFLLMNVTVEEWKTRSSIDTWRLQGLGSKPGFPHSYSALLTHRDSVRWWGWQYCTAGNKHSISTWHSGCCNLIPCPPKHTHSVESAA